MIAQLGFLLLCSHLGNPLRNPLNADQLRQLTDRTQGGVKPMWEDENLTAADLGHLGYAPALAEKILRLLEEEQAGEAYVSRGIEAGCVPILRGTGAYPKPVRIRLSGAAPGCLWAKGDLQLLNTPAISLVGSRKLAGENDRFAREVGRQAAIGGYTLISGNARGADQAAQEAALRAGGKVISVVADSLTEAIPDKNVLYLSEDDFDAPFSAQRALSRNRVIHSLGQAAFVAQTGRYQGGTWGGTVRNLHGKWCPVFCFHDGSDGSLELGKLGAHLIGTGSLRNIEMLLKSFQGE